MLLIRYVEGRSMSPALQPGAIVIAYRNAQSIRVGDVVIIDRGGIDVVKRVSKLSVDKLYVEGDNKPYSTDSRHFGWLDRSSVKGKIIWPTKKHLANPFQK
jgi:phage repressor protein C with HTH and peptisase S24 domain